MAETNVTSTKRLYMVFELSNGKDLTVSLLNPKSNLTSEDVAPVMQEAVTNEVFQYKDAAVTAAKDAYVRAVTKTDLNTQGV